MLAAAFDSRRFSKACSVFNARSFPQFGELSVTHSSERIAFSPALFKPRLAIQPDASSSEKLSNISSDRLPSSTAHTGQTGARGPSGQSVLVLLGSREQCLEFPLIGTKRTSLRHVAAYNVSRMSAFRVKRTPHESAIGTHRTLLLGNARLYRSADGSVMLIHTLWISRLSRGTCSRSRIP